jgi:arylsulfatase A-like enzyme
MLYVPLCLVASLATAETRRPNVLFLISDDMNCRLGCYGDPVAKTPNLDRLSRMGIRFDRAYCQQPLCNCTRSSVLSGRYPTSTGVLDNNTWLVLEGEQKILPRYFESHGYATAEFGKVWHGPNDAVPHPADSPDRKHRPIPGWFTPAEREEQQRTQPDYWKTIHSPYRVNPPDPTKYAWANEFGPLAADAKEADTKIADDAIAQLDKFAASQEPFFLSVGFHKPHVPLKCPQKYFDLYDPAAIPLPPDFANEPSGPTGTPPDELRQNVDLFAARSFTAAEARAAMQAYYACASYMDAQVGRVLDALEQHGLRDNTIVVFWGDHGWHLSEKGMWAKGTTFEVSSRGPLLIVDPRQKTAGQTCRHPVEYLSMYPTLVELCGLPKPQWLEGASLAPLLENPQAAWDRPAFTVQPRDWFIGRSIRTERWRYTEWDEGRRGSMLFDEEHDPHEMHNLAHDPAHQDDVTLLRKQLRSSRVGQSMRRP